MKTKISPKTNPINRLPEGSGNLVCHCGPADGFRIALVIITVITTLTLIATLSSYSSRRFLVSLTSSGLAPLLGVPAEEKAPTIKIQLPMSFPDYGKPTVPQIENVPPREVLLPEPLDHYSVAQAKTEKPAPRRHMHVVRPRPNFFEKLVAGFIKLQKHQAAKSFCKRCHVTSRRG